MEASSRLTSRWFKIALLIGSVLLIGAPLLIFLRANAFLNPALPSAFPTFPIDDGYIYSNYAHHAAEGHWFAYQDSGGEVSGGVTSLLWYLLLTTTYFLVHLLVPALGVVGGTELAAYLLGATLLAISAILLYLISGLLIAPLLPPLLGGLRPLALGLPPLLLLLLTPQASWAALSGLEIPLSMALVLAALYTLLRDALAGRAPGLLAALFAGLLPWARPELASVSLLLVAITVWLALRQRNWRSAIGYLLLVAALGAAMLLIYQLGSGHLLPSSFYAKTGQLAIFSPRFFQAMLQLIADGGWPFLTLFACAALTGLLALVAALLPQGAVLPSPPPASPTQNPKLKTQNSYIALIAAVLTLHTLATSAATVWYGQMERYLLPVFPLALLLVTALPVVVLNLIFSRRITSPNQNSKLKTQNSYIALALLIILGLLLSRDAATGYAIQARNIAQAHIAPAAWLISNTPADTIVATEPVGALRLFSARPTLDLVGLTTPALLGHYRDWDYTWRYLREQHAAYLLYYPQWFKDQGIQPPAWLTPAARFTIVDNRIAGASEIVLYRLDWSVYK
jgi:hypothetical protein